MVVWAHTSIPSWAVPGAATPPVDLGVDESGSSYLLVGVGDAGTTVLDAWASQLAAHPHEPEVRRLDLPDGAAAVAALAPALAEARVGVRLRVAGPVADCLAVRAAAVAAGVEDDELHLAPTGHDALEVFCVHCGAVTRTEAAVDDVVACPGCERDLLVYHHVARRTGHFLGFQVDAETAVPAGAVPAGSPTSSPTSQESP